MLLSKAFRYLHLRHLSDAFAPEPLTIPTHKTLQGSQLAKLYHCVCYFLSVGLPQGDGDRRGGGAVGGIYKNSCDRNEECSVLKGLLSTPEVCFHSLIREPRSGCRFKPARKPFRFKRPDKSLLETCRATFVTPVGRLAAVHVI